MKSKVKYQSSNEDFNKLKNTFGYYRNGLILLTGNKLLQNGSIKYFEYGWYDTNLNYVSNATEEDEKQMCIYNNEEEYIPF